MKILQIISSFPPAYTYGGPAGVAYHISRELARKGHKITVFTTDVYDARSRLKYYNPMNMGGIQVYHFKNLSNTLARNNLPLAPTMAFALKASIKGFDIVHLHEYRSFQAIIGHYCAKKYGIPYVLQAHGSVPQIIEKIRLKKLFDTFYGLRILNDARKLFALTEMEAEQYAELEIDEDKIEIIPNAIDLSEYVELPEKGGFKKKYGLNADEKIVLYLGRLHRIKGLDLLIEAFAELLKDVGNCRLVIVGPDGGYLSIGKDLVANLKMGDKVLFVGPLDNKDKLEAYVDADVYVLPSIYETFPITVLEASICGTPVIVTDRCSIADLVDKKGGIVVPREKEKMRDALFKILTSSDLREKFGNSGKRLVTERFTYPKIVKRIEDVYNNVLSSGDS